MNLTLGTFTLLLADFLFTFFLLNRLTEPGAFEGLDMRHQPTDLDVDILSLGAPVADRLFEPPYAGEELRNRLVRAPRLETGHCRFLSRQLSPRRLDAGLEAVL